MANNTNSKGWTSILNSVRTPLGFFALLALILDGIILATAPLTKVPIWWSVALLGVLIVCVFAIVWKKPLTLYHPKDWPVKERPIRASLIFPGLKPFQVHLDVEHCVLVLRYKKDRTKRTTPDLTDGQGDAAYVLKLEENIALLRSVFLQLTEHGGRKWEVGPFDPCELRPPTIKQVEER